MTRVKRKRQRLTRRQKIRIRSYLQMLLVLLIVAAIIVGAVLLMRAAIRGMRLGGTKVSDTFIQQQPGVVEAPTPSAEPAREEPVMPPPPEVDVNDWSLRLVRYESPLPADFEPELTEIERGERFDSRVAMHLNKLIEDARAAGYGVFVCSGYRSYDTQYMLYWSHVEEYMRDEGLTQEEAEVRTRLAVNYPGASEHQLGLAMDLLEYQGQDMEPYIGGSGLMLWLEEHCADYGFVIRYPDGKTDITGVEYEPWHLRYVGTCARYIMENDLCLEEFLALYD